MSMGGIGACGSHNLSQTLSTLLSRLDTTDDAATATTATDASTTTGADEGKKGWHRGEARLSSDILNVLLRLQRREESAAAAPTADTGSTTDATTTTTDATTTDAAATDTTGPTTGSPIHRLFVAIDSNGDGSVTKEEFESFIQAKGGTQAEADKLFALLDKDNAGALGEDQLAEAAKRGLHRHRGFAHFAEKLFAKIDADGDGKLTKQELEDSVTAKGGTVERADKFFAKADKDGDGAVDQSELTQAIQQNAHRPHGHHGGRGDGDRGGPSSDTA
jgi:Ca2+-binding EF-hand superfamily protein